jgi:hypothetical protein
MGHVLMMTRLGPLDVLAVIEEGKTYEDLLAHTIEIEFRGHTIRFLDLNLIKKIKKNSKDPKHNPRLPILEETLLQLEKEFNSDPDTKRSDNKYDNIAGQND